MNSERVRAEWEVKLELGGLGLNATERVSVFVSWAYNSWVVRTGIWDQTGWSSALRPETRPIFVRGEHLRQDGKKKSTFGGCRSCSLGHMPALHLGSSIQHFWERPWAEPEVAFRQCLNVALKPNPDPASLPQGFEDGKILNEILQNFWWGLLAVLRELWSP